MTALEVLRLVLAAWATLNLAAFVVLVSLGRPSPLYGAEDPR